MSSPITTPPLSSSPPSLAQRWVLAARPRTLPAAISPVLVGIAAALQAGEFRPVPALATLLAALLLQIGANLANDVFDFQRGADTQARLGPVRVTAAGLLSPHQVLAGMWVTFGLAAMLGLYLAWVSGWPVIAIGLLAIAAAVAYTGGPFPYGYYGMGELFVFLFFGPAAVCGTFYIQTGELSLLAAWASVPMGLLTTAILIVNNLRDIDSDRATGKRTLAARFGANWTRAEFMIVVVVAYLVPLALWLAGMTSAWVMLSWLSLIQLPSLLRTIQRETGRPLNKALAATGQLELWFAILFGIGLLL